MTMTDSPPVNTNNQQTQSPTGPIAFSEANDPPPPPPPPTNCHGADENGRRNDDSNNIVDNQSRSGNVDGPSDQHQQLPIEYQLYEVDLSAPDMDPLEWTFRRYVPIPKEYFWDTASETNDYNHNLPFGIKMWHRSIYYLGECLKKAESGGEVVANFLGLNTGPFDYVTNNMTEEEMAQSRENVERRREERVESERRKEGVV
ncbi:hypothetical protein ACHAXR_006294 [Thalassiosira sp. AJA248-18]